MIYTLMFILFAVLYFFSFGWLFKRYDAYETFLDSSDESLAILSHLVQVNSEWMDKRT